MPTRPEAPKKQETKQDREKAVSSRYAMIKSSPKRRLAIRVYREWTFSDTVPQYGQRACVPVDSARIMSVLPSTSCDIYRNSSSGMLMIPRILNSPLALFLRLFSPPIIPCFGVDFNYLWKEPSN